MKIKRTIESSDRITTKFIQETIAGELVESTYVDYPNKHIICFSTQFGCLRGCTFCANGISKKAMSNLHSMRNLHADELFSQIYNILQFKNLTDPDDWQKPVLLSAMGCGEPLHNANNLVKTFDAFNTLYDKNVKYAISTTVPDGFTLLKFMDEMEFKLRVNVKLQISLHSAIASTRKKMMPNSIADISEFFSVIRNNYYGIYQEHHNSLPNKLEFNVVLIDGVNDSDKEADALARSLNTYFSTYDFIVKLNQFNEIIGCDYKASNRVEEYKRIIEAHNIAVEVYETNGSDIGAACGQLTSI